MKKVIVTKHAPSAIGPYAQANLCNGVLYISGQIAINPETGQLLDGIEAETHQVMKNLSAILEAADLNFSHVVKTSIFLKNMEDFQKMNEIYGSYLDPENLPARETVQVSCLPKNVSIEISMIAHKP